MVTVSCHSCSSDILSRNNGLLRFVALEKKKHGQQQEKGQHKKYHSTLVMQSSEKKVGVDVNGEKSERGDSNAILQDHQEQAEGDEKGLIPKIPEAKMGHEQRHDEKRHTRPNAAALFCHLNADLREMKHQTLTQGGDSQGVEQ